MDQLKDRGVTLIELLVVLAILAIVAVGGVSLLRLLPSTRSANNGPLVKEAVRQLYVYALTDEGAELTYQNGALNIVTLGANTVHANYTLSGHPKVLLNGKPFSCLILNYQGFPYNSVSVPHSIPACHETNPTTPMTWSVQDAEATAYTFS